MTFEEREDQEFDKFWERHKADEVQACPFCGGIDVQIEQGHGRRGKFYYVLCEGCFAKSGTSKRVESAYLGWQKRASTKEALEDGAKP